MAAFISSFHHDVSLHGEASPRDSPSTSLTTLLMQLAILFHVVLGSSWAFQSASCTSRSTKTPWLPSFNRHHLNLESNLHLIFLNLLLIRISKINHVYQTHCSLKFMNIIQVCYLSYTMPVGINISMIHLNTLS